MARRVGKVLGLSSEESRLLLARARADLGRRNLGVKALAFTVATAPVVGRLLPRRVREAAIRPLVYALIPGPAENLLYAGLTATGTRADDLPRPG
jgi:hypothetical protein